jgi:iron-sulfur cluster repair protein YtfE (RIC family)
MPSPLPTVAGEHQARLIAHVDRMPAIGDRIGVPGDVAADELAELLTFLTGTLQPHMVTAEQTLYPELERLLQNRHSMEPMRREHARIDALMGDLVRLHDHIGPRPPTTGEATALRRAVFSLYALLKVHLAEEGLYLLVVEQGVTDEVAGVLAAAMEHPMVGAA